MVWNCKTCGKAIIRSGSKGQIMQAIRKHYKNKHPEKFKGFQRKAARTRKENPMKIRTRVPIMDEKTQEQVLLAPFVQMKLAAIKKAFAEIDEKIAEKKRGEAK